jgi:hypothetical protein
VIGKTEVGSWDYIQNSNTEILLKNGEVDIMALDPNTTKLIIQAAIKVTTDEKMRKRLLIFILSPIIALLFLIILFYYIISSPFEAISTFFTDEDQTHIQELQKDYGFNQTFDSDDKIYLESHGKDYSNVTFKEGVTEVQYFNQADKRWADLPYGETGTIGTSGCGPTCLTMVITTLTGHEIDPIEMCDWSVKNGFRCEGNGSYHSLIPAAARNFGLQVEGCKTSESQKIIEALSNNKLVIAIMSKGHFTQGGHFIVLRGITEGGKILVADPISQKRSEQEWDLNIILDEANKNAGSGGPFWIIGN